MKLFKQMLVAPAALGLLAPLTATAAELNLNDVSSYSNAEVESISNFSEIYPTDWAFKAISDVATSRGCSSLIPSGTISRFEAATIINSCFQNVAQLTEQEQRLVNEFGPELAVLKSRVDGLETRMNDFEAGGFSETTTASFSADFAIGATTQPDGPGPAGGGGTSEGLMAGYGFQIDLSTSFTGEDSFDVSLDAGNASGAGISELDLNSGGDGLAVDGIAYTFPIGDSITAFVGDNMDGSTLYNTACTYGGPSNTLDDCGNASSALAAGYGTAAGASYDFGNGFILAAGYEGQGDTASGLFTKEGTDAYGGQLSYSSDAYGVSVTYADIEGTTDTKYWGLNGYFTPSETSLPSISIGYEVGNPQSGEDTTGWFAGFQWDEVGPGSLGAAVGTQGGVAENADEPLMYEAYYSYPVNDGMTITPLVYVQEDGTEDKWGTMVKTSFSF